MTDKKLLTSTIIFMTPYGINTPQMNIKKSTMQQTNKSKKPRAKPTHPRTAEMVNCAIRTLKERGGSSLQAIKKYISVTYKIDVEKQAPFIKKYLKSGVSNGSLIQTKGKGAAGSFKLSIEKIDINKKKGKSVIKSTPLKKIKVLSIKKSIGKKTLKKITSVKTPNKVANTEKRKTIKGPAGKPPKVKSAVKVKVAQKLTAKKTLTLKKALPKAKVTKKLIVKKVNPKKK